MTEQCRPFEGNDFAERPLSGTLCPLPQGVRKSVDGSHTDLQGSLSAIASRKGRVMIPANDRQPWPVWTARPARGSSGYSDFDVVLVAAWRRTLFRAERALRVETFVMVKN